MKGLSGGRLIRSAFLAALVLAVPALLAAKEKNPSTYRIPLPPKPDFSSVEWMIGNWTGQMGKHSPQGEIHLSVSYDLDHRVMVFRETITLAATGEIPADNESSMGILSRAPSGDAFLLQVYSSTGFISSYRVTVEGSEIDFTSNGGLQPLPGWLSRRIIQRSDVDGFTETVQLAPPLRPFFDYYTAAFIRQPAPKSSKAAPPPNPRKP
ncbi:MAG TPA: hypothetical protein VMW51_08250 [Terriglobia bacterium]|nr:hypothetical protein [Terriglobia bacterium]